MATGPIVRLVRDRGFGFVRAEDGSEIFFHHSTLPPGQFDALQEGQQIEFDIETYEPLPVYKPAASRRQIEKALEMLNAAERPVIVAGGGIINADASDLLVRFAEITGWGKSMPSAVMTNDDMASIIDTSDEWIRTRSGIRERRVSHVPGSELARVAGARALAAAGRKPDEVDLLLVLLGKTADAEASRARLESEIESAAGVVPRIEVLAIPDAKAFAGLESTLRRSEEDWMSS